MGESVSLSHNAGLSPAELKAKIIIRTGISHSADRINFFFFFFFTSFPPKMRWRNALPYYPIATVFLPVNETSGWKGHSTAWCYYYAVQSLLLLFSLLVRCVLFFRPSQRAVRSFHTYHWRCRVMWINGGRHSRYGPSPGTENIPEVGEKGERRS